jgi:hypothetical protein
MISARYHQQTPYDCCCCPIVDDTIDFGIPDKLISDYNESQCIHCFRFQKLDLQTIANNLWFGLSMFLNGTKECIKRENDYCAVYETGLCILLYRLHFPSSLRPEMERLFCIRKLRLSAILTTFTSAMYQHCIPYFTDPSIFYHRFPLYAHLISIKSNGAATNIWGFVDGALRESCRPSKLQRLHYSGHKKSHGIKFQSVVTPDGLIAGLFGPIPGSRHDSFLLAQSRLIPQMRQLMPNERGRYVLYGDSAHPLNGFMVGAFRNPASQTRQADWNTEMAKVRLAVEWLFGRITALWSPQISPDQ